MADFFEDQQKAVSDKIAESLNIQDEPEEIKEENKEEEVVGKIKVGDNEYTQEELNKLVGLGKIGLEAEAKFNTKIDKVWPEFTKSRAEINELKGEVEKLKQGTLSDDDSEAVIAAAKKYGLMTIEDARAFYAEQRASEKLLEKTEQLEEKYNGVDGRPRFEKIAILEYMRDNGINDPEIAYKVKYDAELESWKEKKLTSAKKDNIVSNKSGGTGVKEPTPVVPNRNNLNELIQESLGQ